MAAFSGWYDRLADAAASGAPLGAVLDAEVDAVEAAALAEAQAANPGAESFGWMRAHTPLEDVHELAHVVDVLIELGEVTPEEAERFFRTRAQRLQTVEDHVAGDGEAARRHLETVWPSLSWVSQRDLPSALVGVGLLDAEEREEWERKMRPGPWEQSDSDVGDVGEALERTAGPDERRCGMRVLAFERCERGSVVHLHVARARRDEHGAWPALPDEVVGASAAAWPAFPELRLEDDLGTPYRGAVAADDVARASDSSVDGDQEAHFAPAVPSSAGAVWLVSDDPQVRLRLL